MSEGQILAACKDGAYVLRLKGDVRVTLCSTFDEFLEQMFGDPVFKSVTIDLCQAEGIDSTSLGLLAKLAIQSQKRFQFKPVIFSSNASITRILDSMGFSAVFDIRPYELSCDKELQALPQVVEGEGEICLKVIDAHRILMGMNPENEAKFKGLVEALESQRSTK